MRRVHHIDASAILPERRGFLVRAGVPADREPSARVLALAERAAELFVELAEPVGVWETVPLEDLLRLVRAGRPEGEEAVVEQVALLGRRLALYAATVGEPVCARIRQLFVDGEAPLGLLLDAVASEATAVLADELGELFLDERRDPGLAVLAYSPGYCGWLVSGQRALFSRLEPGDAGITLGESALMAPVKSVSGVLVAAPPEAHRFRPDFAFCDYCTERSCLTRMLSLRSPEGEPPTEGDVSWTS